MTNFPPNRQFDTLQSPRGPVPPEVESPERSAVLATLWRGKLTIALTVLLCVGLAGVYAHLLATPLYRSTAVVILETQQQQIVDLQGVMGGLNGDTSEVNSQAEVLRSRGLLGKVVDRLGLVADPEFNVSLRAAKPFDEVRERAMSALGVAQPPATLPEAEARRRERDAVVSALLEAISVRNVPLSLVFEVTAETANPEKSALIADTIAELYVLDQLEVKFEASEKATTWLTQRVSDLRQQLEDAERVLSEFSTSSQLVSVEALQGQEVQLKELRQRLAEAEGRLAETAARLQTLKGAGTRKQKARLADDPLLDRDLDRAATSAAAAAAFDARFAQVVSRAEADLSRLRAQASALKASETNLSGQIQQRSADLIELQQYQREADAIRLLYEYFLTRLNETTAQQGIQKADSRVLSKAVVSGVPSAPRTSLILAISAALGLVLGAGLVLVREARSKTFRTARELEAWTGCAVLGQIPVIPVRTRRRLNEYLADKPTSAASEAFRNLRTALLATTPAKPPQVILSTSAVPGEGKTTNALALARNLTGLGKNVLLVEGDIRRGMFGRYFDGLPETGLPGVLDGKSNLAQAVHRSATLGADVLAGPRGDANPADLFATEAFGALISEARTAYDMVIIDAPPVLVVPDALIIARLCDAVLFTVWWDRTSREQVEEALRLFANSGQRVTGLVLSQINLARMKSYGHGGRYGAYPSYGGRYYAS